jgi:hypothetical protein
MVIVMAVRLPARNTTRTDTHDRDSRPTTPAWMAASTMSITAKGMVVGTVSTTRGSMIKVAASVRMTRIRSIVVFCLGEAITRHARSLSRAWCQTSSKVNDASTSTADHPPRILVHEACLPLVLTWLRTGLARVRHTTRELGKTKHFLRHKPVVTSRKVTAGEDLTVVFGM